MARMTMYLPLLNPLKTWSMHLNPDMMPWNWLGLSLLEMISFHTGPMFSDRVEDVVHARSLCFLILET